MAVVWRCNQNGCFTKHDHVLLQRDRSDPLQLWAKRVGPPPSSASKPQSTSNDEDSPTTPPPEHQQEPRVDFVVDDTLNSQVLEILSTHLPTTFITTPSLATRT